MPVPTPALSYLTTLVTSTMFRYRSTCISTAVVTQTCTLLTHVDKALNVVDTLVGVQELKHMSRNHVQI